MGASADDAVSDWEAEISSSDHESELNQPQASANSKGGKKVDTFSKVKEFKIPSHLAEPRSDPAAERERIREIEELRDIALSGDIFGVEGSKGVEDIKARSKTLLKTAGVKNTTAPAAKAVEGTVLEKMSLSRFAEIEQLCDILTPKIVASTAKSNAWMKFLDRLIAACAVHMEPDDLKTVERKAAEARKQQSAAKNIRATNSKKVNQVGVNLKNYQDEIDAFDGVGVEGSSDEEEYQLDDDIEIDPEYKDFM